MATRLDYRNRLKHKILGLEDEGYGDFEYADEEYDTYLEFAVARLFPALYQRKVLPNVPVVGYGLNNYGSATAVLPERIYMVEDVNEQLPLTSWQVRPTGITKLDAANLSAVNIYYIDAYSMPADDITDAGIPAVYTPLIVAGALIEALEARHDTGARPDPPAGHSETSLLDRLINRYERLKEEMAMSLPAVTV